MLELIVIVLILSWAFGGGLGGLGFGGFRGGFGWGGGGIIHILLVLACVVILLRVLGVR